MIFHVERIGFFGNSTDFSTRSFYEASYRRHQLMRRGLLAEVRTGSGRLVIDALGGERR